MGRSTLSRLLATSFALILALALMPRAQAAAQAAPTWTYGVETPHAVWSTNADWVVGTQILVLVNDGATGAEFAGTTTVEQTGPDPADLGWYLDTQPFEIEADDIVTVQDAAGDVKSHTVLPLTIDAVDRDNDWVTGHGPVGASVEAYADDSVNGVGRVTTVAGDGTWVADFSTAPDPFDIRLDTWGGASIVDDDGDATHASWNLPMPTIEVNPESDRINGVSWDIGSTVSATVDDPATGIDPDWTASGVVIPAPWNPSEGHIEFVTSETGFDMLPGHVVNLADGTTTKTYTVAPLTFTGVDVEADSATGTATPEAVVEVTVHAPFEMRRTVTAAATGRVRRVRHPPRRRPRRSRERHRPGLHLRGRDDTEPHPHGRDTAPGLGQRRRLDRRSHGHRDRRRR
jgi:hypothetical protein